MREEGQKGMGRRKMEKQGGRWGGQTVREYIGKRKRAKKGGGGRMGGKVKKKEH